jgi:hypothetical protein
LSYKLPQEAIYHAKLLYIASLPIMPSTIELPTRKPIAIIGIAFRGPGDARDPEAFYRMLVEGRSARSKIPKDRYNVDAFYHPDPERMGSIQQR